MAYADRNTSGSRVVAIVLVSIILALVGYGFVTGLAYQYIKKKAEELNAFDVNEPPPPPEEVPPPPPPDTPVPPPPTQVYVPPAIVNVPSPPPPTITTPTIPPPPPLTPPAPPAPPAPPPPPPPRSARLGDRCRLALRRAARGRCRRRWFPSRSRRRWARDQLHGHIVERIGAARQHHVQPAPAARALQSRGSGRWREDPFELRQPYPVDDSEGLI